MSTSDFSPGHRALPRIFANPKESQLAEITQLLFQSGFKGAGLTFFGNQFQLYARVYARDLYQYNWQTNSDVGAQEVAFVLTLSGPNDEPSIYNSTAQMLGNFVESAVLNQEIEINNQ
jgi:hypothetical protein